MFMPIIRLANVAKTEQILKMIIIDIEYSGS